MNDNSKQVIEYCANSKFQQKVMCFICVLQFPLNAKHAEACS
jgi:hypothetical protein